MKHSTAVLCLACAIGGAALTWPIMATAQKPGSGADGQYKVVRITAQMSSAGAVAHMLNEHAGDGYVLVESYGSENGARKFIFRKGR